MPRAMRHGSDAPPAAAIVGGGTIALIVICLPPRPLRFTASMAAISRAEPSGASTAVSPVAISTTAAGVPRCRGRDLRRGDDAWMGLDKLATTFWRPRVARAHRRDGVALSRRPRDDRGGGDGARGRLLHRLVDASRGLSPGAQVRPRRHRSSACGPEHQGRDAMDGVEHPRQMALIGEARGGRRIGER